MKCFEFLLKFVTVAFSGVVLVAGGSGLAAGLWMMASPASFRGLLGQTVELEALLSVLNYLLMAVGAFLVVVGFLGCYGAVNESRKTLLLHFAVMLVLFMAGIAGAVAYVGFADELAAKAVREIKEGYGDESGLLTQFWKVTMDAMGCCGVHNYTDFVGSPRHAETKTFPSQCCASEPDGDRIVCDSHRVHNASSAAIGCLPKFRGLLEENQRLVALVILVVMYVEICTMVISMILYCKVRMKGMVEPEDRSARASADPHLRPRARLLRVRGR